MALNLIILSLVGISLTLVLLIAKYTIQMGVHPLHFAFLQALGAAITIGVINLKQKKRQDSLTIGYYMPYFIIAGLLGVVIPQVIMLLVITKVGVGVVSLTTCLPLVVTYFLSIGFKLEKCRLKLLLSLSVTVSGSFIYFYQPNLFITQQALLP